MLYAIEVVARFSEVSGAPARGRLVDGGELSWKLYKGGGRSFPCLLVLRDLQ